VPRELRDGSFPRKKKSWGLKEPSRGGWKSGEDGSAKKKKKEVPRGKEARRTEGGGKNVSWEKMGKGKTRDHGIVRSRPGGQLFSRRGRCAFVGGFFGILQPGGKEPGIKR